MDRTTNYDTTAGPACHAAHARELRAAIGDVLDGLGAIQAIGETLRPHVPSLDWAIRACGIDATKALAAAARVERATCQAVAA